MNKEKAQMMVEFFQSPGWNELSEDITEKLEAGRLTLENPQLNDAAFRFLQGRLDAYRAILAYPKFYEAQLQEPEIVEAPVV